MDPSYLLSYYPTYEILDRVRSYKDYTEMNIFVDLKNVLQTLYLEFSVKDIVETTKKCKFMDSSILSSVLSFIVFHKKYCLKRKDLKIRFYFFFEVGKSYYHLNFYKDYKSNRKIDDLYGLDKESRDLFFNVVQMNLEMIENVGNKIPNTKVYKLENLEADFIPYYLVRRKLVPVGDHICNLVYSNDHDLLQCIDDNSYVFVRSGKMKKVVRKGEVMKTFLKTETNLPDEVLPLAMSVLGDSGDGIKGVTGIGSKRFNEIGSELLSLCGGVQNLYSNVVSGRDIFQLLQTSNQNKYIVKIIEEERNNKLISTNLKLMSFEVLTRFLDEPTNTEMFKKKERIEKVSLLEGNVVPAESLKKALQLTNVYLEDETIDLIYY